MVLWLGLSLGESSRLLHESNVKLAEDIGIIHSLSKRCMK